MRKTCCLALFLLISCTSTADAAGTTYTGEVVLRSLTPTRVAVFLDTNSDHVVDNGFLLTTDVPIGSFAVRLATARLIFTDGYVRIASDKKIYDLQVAGYPDPPKPPAESEVTTLIGSALMHSEGDSGCSMQHVHEKDPGVCYAYGAE
ncbi:MAG TPA: hypothetical protein VE010_21600 [Thermoanaerobaculia bacterium]|nr:hypothetical protein [Thermoanaerobaculia bacterium]